MALESAYRPYLGQLKAGTRHGIKQIAEGKNTSQRRVEFIHQFAEIEHLANIHIPLNNPFSFFPSKSENDTLWSGIFFLSSKNLKSKFNVSR